MPKNANKEDSVEISSTERFQPRNDDDDELWDVEAIVAERTKFYKVDWAGVDPATGKKWPQSWVRKGDITDDLVKKWKLKKKQKQQEQAARKRRKSGKRDSTISAAIASTSTRRSASTVKALTPVSEGSRLSNQPDVIQAGSRSGKVSDHDAHSSRFDGDPSLQFKEASPLLEELEGPKRKRHSSGSASVTPQNADVSHSPPVKRPLKKRRLGSRHDLQENNEEDHEVQRLTNKGLHNEVAANGESKEKVQQNGAKEKPEEPKKSGGKGKPLKKGRTTEKEQEEQEQEEQEQQEQEQEQEQDTPPVTRPLKKRRLGSRYNLQKNNEEDVEIQRPTTKALQHNQVVANGKNKEEVQQNGAEEKLEVSNKSGRKEKPLRKGRTTEKEQEQEEEEEEEEQEQEQEQEAISEKEDNEVVVSLPLKGAKSRPQPRPTNDMREHYTEPKKRVLNAFPTPLLPTKQTKDSIKTKLTVQQTNGMTRTPRIEGSSKETKQKDKAKNEADVGDHIGAVRKRRAPKLRSRQLSPDTLERLKQFDAELEELEWERKRQESNAQADAGQEVEEEDETPLEYVSPAVPPHSPPSRFPDLSPAPQAANHVRQLPQRYLVPIVINEKTSDDSFRQSIVPETEPENLSTNTQSQSQSQSQPAPSLPSMVVEPPTSSRSRPSTSSQGQTSKPRPNPSNTTSKRSIQEQPPSQDADISTPFDSIGSESQEVLKPPKPIHYSTTAGAQPSSSADSSNRAGGSKVKESSIEQFSSPEKPRLGKGKAREPNGQERSPESAAIHRRGQQLAETARLAKLQSRQQPARRPLSEVITQQVQHSRNILKNGVPLTSLPHPVLSSTLESVSSLPKFPSRTLADGHRKLPNVSDKVVQELGASSIELDVGTNKQTEDDTVEDRSISVQKSSDHSAVNGSSVLLLRQEEEESTQDLLREVAVAAEKVQVTDRHEFDVKTDNEMKPPRSQEMQPPEEVKPAPRGSPRLDQVPSPSVRSARTVELPQRDLGEQAHLNKSSPQESLNSELREIKAMYDRDKAEWQAGLASLKAEWEAERASSAALVATAVKTKEESVKEANLFREQYARASAFVTSVRDENVELEKRIKIAEDQAKSGVAMVRATFESRIRELEQHVEKWQMMATFLIKKDQRTDNDELRRRAAEEPELRMRCINQEEEINALNSEILQLEDELKLREKMVEEWKQEAHQLAGQLSGCKAEVERLTQAAVENEMVYRCLWRLENSKPCEEIFSSAEDLKTHLYSAGHMTWD